MNPVCEVRVPITLDCARTLIFNFNTVRAFESASKSRYWAFVGDLMQLQGRIVESATERWKAAHPGQPVNALEVTFNYMDLMRDLSMEQLQTLVWAALHEYGPNDKPTWPLTIDQIGRYITPLRIIEVFRSVITGLMSNNPTSPELGEASAPAGATEKPAATTTTSETTTPASAEPGGTPSTELPADAFA